MAENKSENNSNTLIILPVFNNAAYLKKIIPYFDNFEHGDLLVVDRGSTDSTMKITEGEKWIKYIRHEMDLGYGSAILNGIDYAQDFEYEYIVTLNNYTVDIYEDLTQIIENLKYGFDIVTISRILENYDHEKIPEKYIKKGNLINESLNEITKLNLTDPISGLKGIKVSALKDLYLTEFDHGIMLQLFIQAAYYDLSVIEVPAIKIHSFGREFDEYEDSEGYFLSIIETEKFLYSKKNSATQ